MLTLFQVGFQLGTSYLNEISELSGRELASAGQEAIFQFLLWLARQDHG